VSWRRAGGAHVAGGLPGISGAALRVGGDGIKPPTFNTAYPAGTATVRRRLAENGLKPWRKDMWCMTYVGKNGTRLGSAAGG
jgi:hypothetical protein